jgi:hypothetical protein
MLQSAYITSELGARDTYALTYLVAVAIPVETFTLFTAVTLREEEMVVYTPSHLHSMHWLLALLPFINDALAYYSLWPSRTPDWTILRGP